MRGASWAGCSTIWTARSFERINTRPAQRGDPSQEALGRSRGGFSTKLHVRAEQHGKPLVLLVSPGQAADLHYVAPLLEQGAVPRSGPGRPALRPDRVVGDKGYSYRVVRRYLQRRGIGRVIPRRRDQGR